MKPTIYIDHIKPIEGQIEVNSIVRARNSHNFIGRVYSIGTTNYTVIVLRGFNGSEGTGSDTLDIANAELIKCKITIK